MYLKKYYFLVNVFTVVPDITPVLVPDVAVPEYLIVITISPPDAVPLYVLVS